MLPPSRLFGALVLAIACGAARAQAVPDAQTAQQAVPDAQPAQQAALDAQPALQAAESWLAGLDAMRYGAAWEDAAPMLRESMTKVQWETGLEAARGPLGVVVSRKLRQAVYSRGRPGDPEAELYVIQYDARFQNRPLTTEIVTPLKGADGVWRISGYVLR